MINNRYKILLTIIELENLCTFPDLSVTLIYLVNLNICLFDIDYSFMYHLFSKPFRPFATLLIIHQGNLFYSPEVQFIFESVYLVFAEITSNQPATTNLFQSHFSVAKDVVKYSYLSAIISLSGYSLPTIYAATDTKSLMDRFRHELPPPRRLRNGQQYPGRVPYEPNEGALRL